MGVGDWVGMGMEVGVGICGVCGSMAGTSFPFTVRSPFQLEADPLPLGARRRGGGASGRPPPTAQIFLGSPPLGDGVRWL